MLFKRIALGISGGVDSAVSALLLKRKGFDVSAVFMRNWEKSSEDEYCDVEKDIEDAQWVCKKLQIPFYEVDFTKDYWVHVFENTMKEYQAGFTPNPDIMCNASIKFDRFFNHCVNELDFDAIAMGHYVRSSFGSYLENYVEDRPAKLLMGRDGTKDQSFFLSRIAQRALQRTMFPVGEFTKSEVKEIAHEEQLHRVLEKKESMGLCFIGKRNFQSFMSQYVADKPGRFIDVDTGDVVGKHKGVHLWTIGQRARVSGSPVLYFVVHKDAPSGDIFVCIGQDHPALFSRSLVLSDDQWMIEKPGDLIECEFRIFHRRPLKKCHVITLPSGKLLLEVDEPIHVAAPGQFAVFYKDEECLGSAKIISIGYLDWFNDQVCDTRLSST